MVHGTADTAVAVAMNVMDTGKDHFLEDGMIIEEDLILEIAETILVTSYSTYSHRFSHYYT